MIRGSDRPVEILLVEDNPADVRLTQEAFKESDVPNNLHVVQDGREALSFLRRKDTYAGVAVPDIILLDLNLPKVNGHEVLAEIKTDDNLKYIPVLILTTSRAEKDIVKTYELQANCYITKPVDLDEFVTLVKYIEYFWLSIVRLPRR
ncbi:MAG: response regulator [Kiritimatiellae bacterium]|nr:response regulator [Kiritimatiellia bacterium]